MNRLVYVEEFDNINEVLHREKYIKKWNRKWKLRMIKEQNPDWNDLMKIFYDMDFCLRGNDINENGNDNNGT